MKLSLEINDQGFPSKCNAWHYPGKAQYSYTVPVITAILTLTFKQSIMKRILCAIALATVMISTLPSCATVLGGRVDECQRKKPAPGEPSRKIRVGALIADILLIPVIGLIVDFSTNAIYKPCSVEGNTTNK